MTSLVPPPPSDPTLAVAERQLAMLGELAEIGMAAARAFGCAAIATAKAEEGVVSEDWFVPEVGRARACGARDAAESLRKVSRAVRLTLVLEMNLAEIVRDIRAGKITYIGGIAHRNEAGGITTPAGQAPARSRDRDVDTRSRDRDTECFAEFDRPDILSPAAFRGAVEKVCDDVGAAVDWAAWKITAAASDRRDPIAPPPDRPPPATRVHAAASP